MVNVGGTELEFVSVVIGGVIGYIIGHMLGKQSAMGMGMGFSDKNQKKDIKHANTKKFLDSLKSYAFRFKNPKLLGAAEGQRFGVLAQDLEKTEIGKSIVVDSKHGKMIDTTQGFGVVLAALSDMNTRLDKIEKKLN